ncbi:hypothetical protein E2562_011858 [Oryza meyeriana var. granulata]|uniref:Uncharacterized protein n=1 Tax=Oryza meyeriana var. granulata TaxID=110450 RepID=A0A6G1CPE8_9ORYZ|nr:hypothetical protein E2562_011858 [Oryza meyeriana var. granulata]
MVTAGLHVQCIWNSGSSEAAGCMVVAAMAGAEDVDGGGGGWWARWQRARSVMAAPWARAAMTVGSGGEGR